MTDRKKCQLRNLINGNCLPIGGFCTAVADEICQGLRMAYEHGKHDSIQATGGWISVKDRLPEIGDTVLFTGVNNYGNRWLLAQRGWFDGTFWKRDTGESIYLPVTHWMPFPEPPEEQQ